MITFEGLIERPDLQTGKSFINGLSIYEWPKFSDEEGKAYLMECDDSGRPLRDGTLQFHYRTNKWFLWCRISVEMLQDEKAVACVVNYEKEKYRKEFTLPAGGG
jgi:hypothetical protein